MVETNHGVIPYEVTYIDWEYSIDDGSFDWCSINIGESPSKSIANTSQIFISPKKDKQNQNDKERFVKIK